MTALCFDIATKTGFAFGAPGSVPRSGVLSFGSPVGDRFGTVYLKAQRLFGEAIATIQPSIVVFEAPLPRGELAGFNAARLLLGLACLLEVECERRKVECREAAVNTVRKHFCGSGSAKKPDVKAECRSRGWAFQDDNAADALALWDYTVECLAPGSTASGPLFRSTAA